MKKRKTPGGVGESLFEEKEGNQLKRKTDKTCDDRTTDSKTPVVPLLIGFLLGSLIGKLLLLLLKIAGVL